MTVYSRAKRAKDKPNKKKKIITCIILAVIILASIYLVVSNRLWCIKKPKDEPQESEFTQEGDAEVEEVVEKQDEISDMEIDAKMGNYNVLGVLVMDKIGLTKNILDVPETEAFKLSLAHMYGTNINESGNFCVGGHNWINMLRRLSEMQVGDTFYMVSRETKTKVNYEIYDMYTCIPTDTSCLDQNNDGKREVTIITCNPGGATRLVCKAREI